VAKLEGNALLTTKGYTMKTLILLIGLTLGALQADAIVAYDMNNGAPETSKPNHPSQEIY